jgi:excisionase family DNA binding protein
VADLLTVAEVATIARVSRQTVHQWVKDGKLIPAMKLPGGALRFSVDAVGALLDAGGKAAS